MTPGHQTTILALGGRQFAFGLRWTTVGPAGNLQAASQQAARADNANFVVVRKRIRQFGVAHVPIELKPSRFRAWHSAAATLADAERGQWLGFWRLADGTVYGVAVGTKGILPDGDRLFANEEDAQAALTSLQNVQHWRRVICPAEWAVPGAVQQPLAELLSGHRGQALEAVGKGGVTGVALKMAGVLAFGVPTLVGLLYWRGYLSPRVVVQEAQAKAPDPVPARYLAAANVAQGCLTAINGAMQGVGIPGWRVGSLSCDGRALSVNYRPYGRYPFRSLDGLPNVAASSDGKTATITYPVQGVAETVSFGPFPTAADTANHLVRVAEKLHAGEVSVPAPRVVAPPVEAGRQPLQAPPLFQTGTFSLTTVAPPDLWSAHLALPNLAITAITLQPVGMIWNLKGITYVAP